jgi:DNA-binding NarL/FixJ family response regulator
MQRYGAYRTFARLSLQLAANIKSFGPLAFIDRPGGWPQKAAGQVALCGSTDRQCGGPLHRRRNVNSVTQSRSRCESRNRPAQWKPCAEQTSGWLSDHTKMGAGITLSDLNATAGARVIVVDNHEAIHAGIRHWCSQADPPIAVVASYRSVDELLTHQRGSAAGSEVVVFDVELQPGRPGLGELQRVVDLGHRVVVYTHITAAEIMLQALEAGAASYVTKLDDCTHLVDAIRAASRGRAHVAPHTAVALCHNTAFGRPQLAPREKEVLLAWFRTDSKDDVARRLSIAPATVRTHLERVRAKYAAAGRSAPTKAALVARAIQDGIISADDI